MIRWKRVHDPPEDHDGARFLVERLWPGDMEEKRPAHGWRRDVAPAMTCATGSHTTPRNGGQAGNVAAVAPGS